MKIIIILYNDYIYDLFLKMLLLNIILFYPNFLNFQQANH